MSIQMSRMYGAIGLSIICSVGNAFGSWPTSPDDPLVLGSGVIPPMSIPAVVMADDRATWVSWIDNQCGGTLLVQRVDRFGGLLTEGGLEVETFPGCHPTDTSITDLPGGAVAVAMRDSNPRLFATLRIHRVHADGSRPWGEGVTLDHPETGKILGLLGRPDGDLLVAAQVGHLDVRVHRLDGEGKSIWDVSLETNRMPVIFRMFDDHEGGAWIVWESHASPSYFRLIWAVRVTSDGTLVWPEGPRLVTPDHPFASRHTPSAWHVDDAGALWVLYSRGANPMDTPVPILAQRVEPDGSMVFEEPVRVSLGTKLQSAAVVATDHSSGDLFIVWRDGIFDTQDVRVQRLSSDGLRLFGEAGVSVVDAPPVVGAPRVVAHWTGEALQLSAIVQPAVPGEPTVRMYEISAEGEVSSDSVPVSGPEQVVSIAGVSDSANQILVGLRVDQGFHRHVVAQRIQSDGTLGGAELVPGDLNGDGMVDLQDLLILLAAWGPCGSDSDCFEDLTGDDVVDLSDLLVLLQNWG